MAAHRYWRVKCLRNTNSQTGIGELQMATTNGGSNVTTGGTPIASGSYGGSYAPSSAFDGNTTSNWFQPGSGPTIWLGYDFGSGNDKDINEVRIAPAVEDSNGTPRFFDVESSDDGSTWAYEWSGLNTSWTNGSYVTFSRPTVQTSNRYWAIQSNINQNGDGDWVATGIEMRTSIGGSQAATGGTASAYPAGSPGPANAFTGGGDANLYYSNNANPHPNVVFYDFGSAISIAEISMQAHSTAGGNNARQSASGYLLYSQDGLAWLRGGSYSGLTWGGGERKNFLVSTGGLTSAAGSLSASATLSGTSEIVDPFQRTAGTLTAAGTLLVSQFSIGTIQSIAQFYASPTMLGRADPARATVGSLSASAMMTGAASARGTISGAGAFAASATFGTDGFATGLIATVGAITGNATLAAVGSGALGSVGAFSAAVTLSAAGGYVPTRTVGTLTAAMTLTAQPRVIYGMVGLATASARFESIANRVAQVAGSLSATGAMLGQVFNSSIGSATASATATFSAAGRGINSSIGSATASATATVFSILFRGGQGALSGTATLVGAQTGILAPSGGTAAAAAFAAVGASIWAARGIFTASAAASATGTGLKPATATFSAAAGLSAPARSTASTKADLQASAAFVPTGQRVGFFSPADRVIVVAAESRKVTVEQGSNLADRTLVIAPRNKVVVIASGDRTVRAA